MPHMEGIFINGEKAKFHPEDILDTDASQYTEEIGESVTAYLTEHLTNPSNPPIDTSLSIAGAAADAKETGDELTQLKSDLSDVDNYIDSLSSTSSIGFDDKNNLFYGLTLQEGYYVNGTGAINNNSNFSHVLIDLNGSTKIKFNGILHIYDSTQFTALGVFFDSNGNYIPNSNINELAGGGLLTFPIEIDVPATAKYVGINTDYKASDYPSSIPDGIYCYPYGSVKQLKKIRILAGAIRNDGNGWSYIADNNHDPIGLGSISVNNSGQLVIGFDTTAKKVLSLVVVPDETFVQEYTIGCSVGLSEAVANIYRLPITYGGRVIISNNSVNIGYSSFLRGTIESDGEIRLYHPTLSGLASTQKFNIIAMSNSDNAKTILGSQGNDYVSLYLKNSNNEIITDFSNTYDLYVNRDVNCIPVNADSVNSAYGNFWIYGVMEVN